MSVIVVGLNHRTAPLEVLERTTVGRSMLPKALADLRARGHLSEVVLLSTCNRTEVHAVAEAFHGAVQDVRNYLCESAGLEPAAVADNLYAFHEDEAARHLFSVAAGIDSAVVGEGEVLGQVRDAWTTAKEEGASGPVLGSLFRHALEVGKRARAETGIARGTTSVPQAAVAMAADRLGGLEGKRIVVLGAGDMGVLMAVALAGAGVADVLVANRTRSKAVALARRAGGRALSLDELPAALTDADVLLTCTGASTFVLDADDVTEIMAGRDGRGLLLVDVALPRDIDPGASSVPGVTLLDIDDLRAFAETGLSGRSREIQRVREIVEEEVARFVGIVAGREVAPVVTALHGRGEAVRAAELERFRGRLSSLDDREREAVEALTKGLVAKLLHDPTIRLKDAAGSPRGRRLTDALRSLFDL